MTIKGQRFIVTGAAQGIGLAIAERFCREGALVALVDRNAELVMASARELQASGRVLAVAADVSIADEIGPRIEDACNQLGGCDGVVNCAGIDLVKPFEETSLAEWERTIAVNLTGPFLVCKAATPFLKRQGGTIVNISSAAGLRPLEERTAYCSSKAGLVMFTKALAIDLAPYEIRANAICPGITDTPQFRAEFESQPDPQAALAEILTMYQIKRMARPEDIASVALFLASDESRHITGAAIAADGGRSFH